MAVRRKFDIGFNRKVRAAWLTETLRLAAAGVSTEKIEMELKAQIAEDNKGKETIRKVFVYLNRVWLDPPDYCIGLRDAALEMFLSRPDSENAFLFNWGMCIAAYPFIGAVAESTGRLLRIQGEAKASDVNVRLRERFGDRHFVHRSVRYNLSTFFEGGALKKGGKAGTYIKARVMKIRDNTETAWIVEALLHSQTEPSMPLQQIAVHGALFPFELSGLGVGVVQANSRLELFRHGLTENLVALKETENEVSED